ncbi:Ankyrin repeat and LEM domain-containing protein 1 [Tupaia chinensis]|uniref:Ankyrin repeat and LEM domain-containing protein 1 n=1 Tax=Tupaia chinensis TaxID=246437 RepID=L9KW76_TUPCH|nr:Ankyrin repeat and LEM domain-containing protein 1 [Tupaia chinensis]
MGAMAELARRLREALREEEPRSAEELTPLHVAAAWGCRLGLELLLRQGADPALRDQDGLRPLDLAMQQGHRDCARVLQELEAVTRIQTRTRAESPKPEPKPEPDSALSGPPDGTLGSTTLQSQPARGDNQNTDLEADLGLPSLPASLEAANESPDRPPASPLWDCSSDASFVTAVEVSEARDPVADPAGIQPTQTVPRSRGNLQGAQGAITPGGEAELSARLQGLTLTSPVANGFELSPSWTSLLDGSPALSPLQEPRSEPPRRPAILQTHDEQTCLDSDAAALWLTEDEESSLGGRDPVPPVCDLERMQGLRALGESPGPVTPLTWRHHLQRLQEAQAASDFAGRSPELAEALRTGRIPDAQGDEDALARQFERPDPTRRWREGVVKSSFTYLLLDPRETQDLPARAFALTPAERLQMFVRAIFYVGKGTRSRPDFHLWEALGRRGQPGKQVCPKVRRILDIWASGRGVVSLHCFQHVVAVEAYTREACLVDALGIRTLTNQKQGHYYGVAAGWPPPPRRRLGVHLLHRALLVFLAEGQRELRPQDIQARG